MDRSLLPFTLPNRKLDSYLFVYEWINKNHLLRKVFAANNVEVVTKTRTEHMSEEDKEAAR